MALNAANYAISRRTRWGNGSFDTVFGEEELECLKEVGKEYEGKTKLVSKSI